jgi:probable phosphoglycerate mutase
VTADALLLWRHGRTASNANNTFQGQLDVPLDDVGRVQVKDAAELLAQRIAGAGCRIVSSDLSRAHETALALAARLDLPVTTDPRLREVFAGRWQGLPHQEIRRLDPDLFAAWRAGEDVAPGGGERRSEAGERAETAIREYADGQDGGALVVASHGAALRGAIMRLVGLRNWSADVLAGLRNAHWAELEQRRGAWVLSSYNVGPRDGTVGVEG